METPKIIGSKLYRVGRLILLTRFFYTNQKRTSIISFITTIFAAKRKSKNIKRYYYVPKWFYPKAAKYNRH